VIDSIYALYAAGVISLAAAAARIKAYLDSKGEVFPFIRAAAITRVWKR
jgi:hypothetical protein